MCNFSKQPQETKDFLHLFITKATQCVGGTNFFLELLEAIKSKKPSGLSEKNSQVASNHTIIKWNKVVYKDKVDLIRSILDAHKSEEKPNFNILDEKQKKQKKNILNMLRTLTPIEFTVTPQNPQDGEGFNFKVFETIEDEKAIFNPVFIALFFCSTEFIKKALKHKI